MSRKHIKKNEIPLKAYLRADSISQHFIFDDKSGELVTSEMFWGTDDIKNSLYLDYRNIQNRHIYVSQGISGRSGSQKLINSECDQWINNSILLPGISKLYVLSGYAGCGKTVFVNSLINRNNKYNNIYVDVGDNWSYSNEPYIFFQNTLNKLSDIVEKIANTENTVKKSIYNKLEEIFNVLISTNKIKRDLIRPIEHILNILTQNNNLKSNELAQKVYNYFDDCYSERNKNNKNHNYGRTDIILWLILFIISSDLLGRNSDNNSCLVIFDNLDIITNTSIPSENVINFWRIMDDYIYTKNIIEQRSNIILPNFNVIITVRKVLYSNIISHLPSLEMDSNLDQENVIVCDISNLYSSEEVLYHRISYWKQQGDKSIIEKFNRIEEISKIREINTSFNIDDNEDDFNIKNSINLDAFFNHNYRAYSNILSILLDKIEYYNLIIHDFCSNSLSKDWQKVATLIFLISYVYRKERIWNSMGFGCNDFDTSDYPTTLNRLILNYLYLAKRGNGIKNDVRCNIEFIPDSEYVSLKNLIEMFEKAIFIPKKINESEKDVIKKFNIKGSSKELVIERLSEMCARNPSSICSRVSGYDSDEDELWRRPLYFIGGLKLKHVASSSNEIKRSFEKYIKDNESDKILFSITDEGYVLINDIVPTFEFYSARYCDNNLAKPLHHALNVNEINSIVSSVHNAVEGCCELNLKFKKQYCLAYKIVDINEYLYKYFHPRTNPHYTKKYNHTLSFKTQSFRPQLHIVRVIYNHISYLNKVKEYFYISNNENKNEMCESITSWILSYLNLYEKYFHKMLNNTICKFDNNVYNDLCKLVKEQQKHYGDKGDYKNINIAVNSRKD